MNRIIKKFQGYPFAHRQPNHDGHCALIHGHNWDFTVELEAADDQLDENDFVYDFGKFKFLKGWFTEMFDHTCLINASDPRLEEFRTMHASGLMNLKVVPSASAEGLAKLIFNQIINNYDLGKAKLVSVTVHEDYKNSAVYSAK